MVFTMDYNRLSKSIIQKADAVLQEAEQEDLMHGLLSLLPAGGFLDSVLFRRIRKRARQRLEEFHVRFAEQLSSLDEQKVDKDFLKSDEFDILVMKVVARTVWEHSDDKRAFLRAILLNSVTYDFSNNPLKERMIELISELSPTHVKVLSAFSDGSLRGSSGFDSTSQLSEVIKSLHQADAEAISHDLYQRGLLDRDRIGDFNSLSISALGESLLTFIRDPVAAT
jgi:hypothetical protein